MAKKKNSITLSPKHGVNPTLCTCFVCGNETGEIAMLGKLKNDEEAPMKSCIGTLCKECQNIVDNGGTFVIEANKDKYRTGRLITFKECPLNEYHSIVYMLPEDFEKLLKDCKNIIKEKE